MGLPKNFISQIQPNPSSTFSCWLEEICLTETPNVCLIFVAASLCPGSSGLDANVPKLLREGCPRAASATFGPWEQQDLVIYFFFPTKGTISDHCCLSVLPVEL